VPILLIKKKLAHRQNKLKIIINTIKMSYTRNTLNDKLVGST